MTLRHALDAEQDRIMAVKARLMDSIKSEMENDKISKSECLCLFAHITGMMIAMQDQRTMTVDQAMYVVQKNIEAGNQSAIEQMLGDTAGTA